MSCCNTPASKCDLYVAGTKNLWVERGQGPNDASCPGICLLETLNLDQVIYIVQHVDGARADLLKVTSDPVLRAIATDVPVLPTAEESDLEQVNANRNHQLASIPFYGIFRGQPPFAQ